MAAAVVLHLLDLIFPRSQRDASLPTSWKNTTTEQIHPLKFEVPHFVQPPPPYHRPPNQLVEPGFSARLQALCLHALLLAEPISRAADTLLLTGAVVVLLLWCRYALLLAEPGSRAANTLPGFVMAF